MSRSDDESTTDKAFRVWTSVIEAEAGRPYWKVVNEHTAFTAGVREGIRQVREAVQREYDDDPPGEEPGYWTGLSMALSTIDALETA